MSKASHEPEHDMLGAAIESKNVDEVRAAVLAKAPTKEDTLERAMATGNREIVRLAIHAVTRLNFDLNPRPLPSPKDVLFIRAFIASGELEAHHPLRALLEQITQKGAAGLSGHQLIIFNEHAANQSLHAKLPLTAQNFIRHHAEEVTLASAHRISLKRIIIQKSYPHSLSGKLADKIGDYLTLGDLVPLANSNQDTRSLARQMQLSFRQMILSSREESTITR